MKIPWEEFRKKYQSADKGVQDILDSDIITNIITTRLDIDTDNIEMLQDTVRPVTYWILGIIDRETLYASSNIPTEVLEIIEQTVLSLIPQKPTPAETPAPEPLLKPSYSATPTEEEKGGSGPLTRDDLIKALSTKRTMATDIENLSKETTPTPPTGN